jgi:hypothetical protein
MTRQIGQMVDLLQTQGFAFFEWFTLSNILDRVTPQQIESEGCITCPRITGPRAALVLARIMKHLGKNDLRRQYAAVGIRTLGRGTALLPELEELAENP